MSIRLHLRRIRVVAAVVDFVENLVIEVVDSRRVVRCRQCGSRPGGFTIGAGCG